MKTSFFIFWVLFVPFVVTADTLDVTSTGVGVNTSSPSADLDVNGDAIVNSLIIDNGQGYYTSHEDDEIVWSRGTNYLQFLSSNAVFSWRWNGDEKVKWTKFGLSLENLEHSNSMDPPLCASQTGGIYICSSSSQFKSKVQDLKSASNLIEKMRPVSYQRGKRKHEFHEIGLIAEELVKVEPRVVTHNKQGEPYGVHYDGVSVIAIAALQEQLKVNKEQEKKISELKAQVEDSVKEVAMIKELVAEMKADAMGVSYRSN